MRLFVVLLGGRPPGCRIEQHDIFFGVAETLEDLHPAMKQFWSASPRIHVDAHMIVEAIGDYDVVPVPKSEAGPSDDGQKLWLVNLGGYQKGEFEEPHKKLLIVANTKAEAIALAKQDPFYTGGIPEGDARVHHDDSHALGCEDDPLDVGSLLAPDGYVLELRKMRQGSAAYPEVVIGYKPIP